MFSLAIYEAHDVGIPLMQSIQLLNLHWIQIFWNDKDRRDFIVVSEKEDLDCQMHTSRPCHLIWHIKLTFFQHKDVEHVLNNNIWNKVLSNLGMVLEMPNEGVTFRGTEGQLLICVRINAEILEIDGDLWIGESLDF